MKIHDDRRGSVREKERWERRERDERKRGHDDWHGRKVNIFDMKESEREKKGRERKLMIGNRGKAKE